MTEPITKAEIEVVTNTRNAVAELNKLSKEIAALSGSVAQIEANTRNPFDNFAKSALGAAGQIAGFTAAVGAARHAVAKFAESQLAFAKVTTIADGATFSIEKIREETQALASQFGGTTAQQANTLYGAISAGATKAEDAIELVRNANRLAIAGFAGTEVVVDGLTTVLNSYNLTGQDSARVSDLLFKTLEVGKTSVEELASSVGQVSNIAATVGLSLEEVFGSIATLSQTTGTAEAVTQLRSALTAVIKPSSEGKAIIKELGLEFDLTALKSKGLLKFFEDIRNSGATEEQLSKLLGRVEALNAVLGLSGANAARAQRALTEVGNAAGSVGEGVGKVNATLTRQYEILLTNIGIAAESTGQWIAELLRVQDVLTGLNRGLAAFNDASFLEFVELSVDFIENPASFDRLAKEIAERKLVVPVDPQFLDLDDDPFDGTPITANAPLKQELFANDEVPATSPLIDSKTEKHIAETTAREAKALQERNESAEAELQKLAETFRTEEEQIVAQTNETVSKINAAIELNPALESQGKALKAKAEERLEVFRQEAAERARIDAETEAKAKASLDRQVASLQAALQGRVAQISFEASQKEEFIRKNVSDEERAQKLITQIHEKALRDRLALAAEESKKREDIIKSQIDAENQVSRLRISLVTDATEQAVQSELQAGIERRQAIYEQTEAGSKERADLLIASEEFTQDAIAKIRRSAAQREADEAKRTRELIEDSVRSILESSLSIAQSFHELSIENDRARQESTLLSEQNRQLAALETARQSELAEAKSGAERKKINQKYGKERARVEEQFGDQIAKVNEEAGRKKFEADKAYSISAAVVNTALGVTQALASIPPPGSYALAAATAAAGIAQVVAISTASYGGGGSVGSVPGVSGAQSTIDSALGGGLDGSGDSSGRSSEPQESTQVTIVAIGDRGVDDMIDAFRSRIGDGQVLITQGTEQARVLREVEA